MALLEPNIAAIWRAITVAYYKANVIGLPWEPPVSGNRVKVNYSKINHTGFTYPE